MARKTQLICRLEADAKTKTKGSRSSSGSESSEGSGSSDGSEGGTSSGSSGQNHGVRAAAGAGGGAGGHASPWGAWAPAPAACASSTTAGRSAAGCCPSIGADQRNTWATSGAGPASSGLTPAKQGGPEAHLNPWVGSMGAEPPAVIPPAAQRPVRAYAVRCRRGRRCRGHAAAPAAPADGRRQWQRRQQAPPGEKLQEVKAGGWAHCTTHQRQASACVRRSAAREHRPPAACRHAGTAPRLSDAAVWVRSGRGVGGWQH